MRTHSEEAIVDATVKELSHLGLFTPEFFPALKTAMKNGAREYGYRIRRMQPGDVTDYILNINLDSERGLIGPDSFEASCRITPPPEHGIYHGIDTAALEKDFTTVRWDREDALSAMADHSNSAVALQLHQLSELLHSPDVMAKEIGEVLAARYLLRTPIENVLDLSGVAANYDRCCSFPVTDLTTALPAVKARNLLLGRSATTFTRERQPVWAYLNFEAVPEQRLQYAHEFSAVKLLGNYDLRELDPPENVLQILERLQAGERVPVHRKTDGQDGLLYIEADAKNKVLLLFEADGKQLPLEQYPVRDKAILPPKIPEGPQLRKWLSPGHKQAKGLKP